MTADGGREWENAYRKGRIEEEKKKYIYICRKSVFRYFRSTAVSMSFPISIYIYIYIYIYIDRESASRFSRGTVLNTLKQRGINILRGTKDATTFSLGKCSCVLFSS